MYQKYTIGRNPDNNIIVPHPSVSGYHADLIYSDSMGVPQYTFIDHSTNGTYINGQWIKNTSCQVGYNDIILLAGCVTFDWTSFGQHNVAQQPYANPTAWHIPVGHTGGQSSFYSQEAVAHTTSEITFVGALKSFFNKYVDFKGRATRREYWYMVLWMMIFTSVLSLVTFPFSFSSIFGVFEVFGFDDFSIATLLSAMSGLGWCLTLHAIFCLVMFIPSLALLVRRIHDTGKDGLWILMLLVPIASIVFFFIWTLTPSEPRPNKWGN